MATVNFAQADLGVVDEKYFLAAKTELVVNKGDIRIDFSGKQTVSIYSLETVAENNYVRSGDNRFGVAIELADSQQDFTLTQDKSTNQTIDRGNLEDTMQVRNAKKHLMRQVREVSVPTTDIYRLSVAFAYAVANGQGAANATATTDIFEKFLLDQAALTDALVPEDGRVAFFTATALNKLKRDPEFRLQCDTGYADNKKGIVGMVDGCMIVKVPASYLPANASWLLIHNEVLISPTKFNLMRILTDQKDIDGVYVQTRRYYDAFIPTNKGAAIRYHKES